MVTRYSKSSDFYFEVARGAEASSYMHKFGRNPDIDNAPGTFEAIWNGGADYTGFDATGAETVEVVSSSTDDDAAGTGARTIVVQGLDGNYAKISETVILDGTTAVDTANTYIRLDRMRVATAGSGGANVGTITASQKTSGTVFAAMPIGYNQTMIAAWTVPAGKTAYLASWFASLADKATAECNIRLLWRPFGEVFQTKEEFALMGAGTSYVSRDYKVPKVISAKADIKIMADSNAANTGVAAGFDLILEDRP